MAENYMYKVKVSLPNKLTTFECNNWESYEGGVLLKDVKDYEGTVHIINAGIIVSKNQLGGSITSQNRTG